MGRFVDVAVSYSGAKVKCEPDPVDLHYNRPEGPNSVRWALKDAGTGDRLSITFDDGGPFGSMQEDISGHVVEGTENTKVEGDYKYTVTIKDAQGTPVAVADPGIRNLP